MTFQADYDDEEVERDEIWLNHLERMQKNSDALQNHKETLRLQESNSEKIRAYSMKVERCKGKRLVEEQTFYGQCTYVTKVVDGSLPGVFVFSLQELQKELREQFHRCKTAHGTLLEVLDEDGM